MINTDTAPYAAFLLRVTLGVLFLAHVALKLFVFTPSGFVGYFASLGLPAVLAWAVMVLEVVGGLALVLGVYATWFAVPLALEQTNALGRVWNFERTHPNIRNGTAAASRGGWRNGSGRAAPCSITASRWPTSRTPGCTSAPPATRPARSG